MNEVKVGDHVKVSGGTFRGTKFGYECEGQVCIIHNDSLIVFVSKGNFSGRRVHFFNSEVNIEKL
jgi:hypothetical protein